MNRYGENNVLHLRFKVYNLETHIKHLHLEASKGYKTQHTEAAMSGWRAASGGLCTDYSAVKCGLVF